MNRIRLLLIAGAVSAGFTALRADEFRADLQTAADSRLATERSYQWLSHYYENPRPDDLVGSVYSLSRAGYFDAAGQPATAIGFFSVVFAQNPQRVNAWLARTSELPATHRRILAAAAWLAGHPAGARQLRELTAGAHDELQTKIAALLASGPVSIAQSTVRSQSSMDLQWGAFLAGGDDRNIVNILSSFGYGEPGLTSAARYALAQNAMAHPRVLAIVKAQLDRQPEAIRAELRAALNEAAVAGAKPGV
jgi:hypothetical protein